MKCFKIWDTIEKSWIGQPFKTINAAELAKENLLAMGDYPDRPHTVYEIRPIDVCKCCGKEYNKKALSRSLGNESNPVILGYCSAPCYTKSVLSVS